MPAPTPDTMPVDPTVANAKLLLLQVPPPVASDNVSEDPTQTLPEPVTADGKAFTVTTEVALQPVGSEYVIVDVPAATPEIFPVVAPAVATLVMLLVQVPPVVALLRVSVMPGHIGAEPVIADNGFTVTIADLKQPVANV